jgi:hypothetical protein
MEYIYSNKLTSENGKGAVRMIFPCVEKRVVQSKYKISILVDKIAGAHFENNSHVSS